MLKKILGFKKNKKKKKKKKRQYKMVDDMGNIDSKE